jgi:hypothetical protein
MRPTRGWIAIIPEAPIVCRRARHFSSIETGRWTGKLVNNDAPSHLWMVVHSASTSKMSITAGSTRGRQTQAQSAPTGRDGQMPIR